MLCGKPCQREDAGLNWQLEVRTTPTGSDTFVTEFLHKCAYTLSQLVEVLASMVSLAQPGAPARQSAPLFFRHCTAAKAAHVQRLAHPVSTVSVGSSVLEGFGQVVEVAAAEVHPAAFLIALPIARGSAGFRPLEWSRRTAHVAAWLHCAAGVTRALKEAIPELADWEQGTCKCQVDVREVVEALPEQDSVDCLDIANATRRDFGMVERPKMQRLLTGKLIDAKTGALACHSRCPRTADQSVPKLRCARCWKLVDRNPSLASVVHERRTV